MGRVLSRTPGLAVNRVVIAITMLLAVAAFGMQPVVDGESSSTPVTPAATAATAPDSNSNSDTNANANAATTTNAPIVPAYRRAQKVAIIPIRGVIDQITAQSVMQRVKRATREGCDAIVLDIDTPGGAAPATLDICAFLKDRSQVPANTVAWIHPTAYSAGTIIALACREIVVSDNATFGDAAPIALSPMMGLQALPDTERAKILAPLLAEIRDSARRNHYDENLVQSFVRVGVPLWLLENTTTGERVVVDEIEYTELFASAPPTQITPTAVTPNGIFRSRINPNFDRAVRPDQSTLSPEEYERRVEAQLELPPTRDRLTSAERADWKLITQVIGPDELLVLKPDEAELYGLTRGIVNNDQELQSFFLATTTVRYPPAWSDALVRFLISWPVRLVLIVVFVLGMLIEMAAPGTGVFGIVAAVALVILLGAPALAGLAQWWDIFLIAAGLLLVVIELFLIPGVGIAGFLGAALLLIGLVGTFISGDLGSPQGQQQMWTGITTIFAAIFGAGVGAWILSRHLHSIPVIDRLILRSEVGGTKVAGEGAMIGAMRAEPAEAVASYDGVSVGEHGVAHTDLRPSGRAEFDGRLIDVQSRQSYIAAGAPVRVTSVGAFGIEVEKVT